MDERLLYLINRQWTSPALDHLMAAASSFALWWPLIALAVVLTIWRGGPHARRFLLTLGILLAVGEGLLDNPLKHVIHRLRPWQAQAGVRQVDLTRHVQPRLWALFSPLEVTVTGAPLVITAADPHPGRSFPSSHTVNNFTAAVVLTFFYRRRGWLYFLPAALVAYSRIYVGAHWPSDVLCSALLAIAFALAGCLVVQWTLRRYWPPLAPR